MNALLLGLVTRTRVLGADLRYDLGGSDPLVGTRMPDLDLSTAGGTTTGVSALLRTGRGLVLGLDETYTTDPLPGGVGPGHRPARRGRRLGCSPSNRNGHRCRS